MFSVDSIKLFVGMIQLAGANSMKSFNKLLESLKVFQFPFNDTVEQFRA